MEILLIIFFFIVSLAGYSFFQNRYWKSKLKEKTKEVHEAQAQVVHMEKMASLGVLAAGIAHEINNPLSFLISNLEALKSSTRDLQGRLTLEDKDKLAMEEFQAMAQESLEGAVRIKKIVSDLRTFSRRTDESQRIAVDLNQILESVLTIVWNEIKYKVTLVKNYQAKSQIIGDPTQLAQVFLNIFINASQAIENKGNIELSTSEDDKYIYIKIADTGSGMPPEVLQKIFDPFFSTKKSTGLGLSVSYNIIKQHKGDVTVTSKPGQGTTFIVKLPIENKEKEA